LAVISLSDVCVDYPIYGYRSDSLKSLAISSVAKMIGLERKSVVEATKIVRALSEITFSASEGDKIGLLGPNGSGKTTLLYVLNQTLAPSSGNILVEGRVTSMLNLSCGVDPNLSGIDNINFRLRILDVDRRERKRVVDDIVAASGLNDFMYLPLRIYSSGMAARLLFCMATAIQSDIVLMDEWLSVGDAEFQESAQKRLQNFVDKSSILVIASHNKSFTVDLCNRVLQLEGGRIVGELS
jgi:lipopolysaccharide transport system ATP-binding protein